VGNSVILQDDFSRGIYRGRRAPPGTVYDAVNALINDEGHLFRRGGATYHSTADTQSVIIGLAALYYPAITAPRVTAFAPPALWALNGTAPVRVMAVMQTPGRPAAVGGITAFPSLGGRFALYGGSVKQSGDEPPSFNASTTAGSTTVTATGTVFLSGNQADAGMVLRELATGYTGVVRSVDTDQKLTMTVPWPVTSAGVPFQLAAVIDTQLFPSGPVIPSIGTQTYVTAAGAGLARMLVGVGNRVYESLPGDAFRKDSFDTNLYHEMPSNVDIRGLEGVGDSAFVFTTGGIWSINNLALDVVDDYGNIQQQVELVSGNIILWQDRGIAAWSGSVIVPALDDVYLISPESGITVLSEPIRPLYRAYVAAGYTVGPAVVHRAHYFLPILGTNGTTPIDTLVCRLDRGAPWTRWAGPAAGRAYAQLTTSTGAPKLLGAGGRRVLDLTGSMEATGPAQDADATTPDFTAVSNDDDLGPGIRANTAEKVRYVYETSGGTPTFAVSSAIGPESAAFTAATLKRGGGASDGTDYSAWHVGRKAERIRFKFTTSSQVTSLILRRREVTIRRASQS
jgi:hypothetical protein